MKHILNLYWHAHWQNLDDDEKLDRADSALSDALHTMGVLTDERWRELHDVKTAFRKKLRGKLGHGWRNGRGWLNLYWGDPDSREPGVGRKITDVGVQWLLLKRQHSIGAGFEAGSGDGDRDLSWWLRGPGFGFYLSLEDALPRRWQLYNPGQKYPSSRQLSVAWHNQALWFHLWADPDESHSRAPFWHPCSSWRTPTIHPLDILFGRMGHDAETLDMQAAEVELPEGRYPVIVIIKRHTWARPRWPWGRKVRINADVRSKQGIPIPGKGEESWDFDEDAYYGIGTSAATVAEAVRLAAEFVMETRKRYGGYDWKPGEANG